MIAGDAMVGAGQPANADGARDLDGGGDGYLHRNEMVATHVPCRQVSKVRKLLALQDHDHITDLFTGTGLFS